MATKTAGTNSYVPPYITQQLKLTGQSRPINKSMPLLKKKGGSACGCSGGKLKKGGKACKSSTLKPTKVGIMYKKK